MAESSMTETELEDQKKRVEEIIQRLKTTLEPLGVELTPQELLALVHQEVSARLKKITSEAFSHLNSADLKVAVDLYGK